MTARRLLFLAAALLLVAALAASLAPEPGTDTASTPPRTAGREIQVVEEQLSTDETDQSVVARVGDLVRLEVAGDVLDQVQIERLDRFDPVEPTTPARFEVIPQTAGVFPIRLVRADRRIGRLDVRP